MNRALKLFLKIFPSLYLLFLGIMLVGTIVFLYRNFYLTLASFESVEMLTRTVSRERLNRKLWDKVLEARIKKLKEPDTAATSTPLRDPFTPQ